MILTSIYRRFTGYMPLISFIQDTALTAPCRLRRFCGTGQGLMMLYPLTFLIDRIIHFSLEVDMPHKNDYII